MKQFPKMHRRRPITTLASAEALERRTLLADPLVSINVKQNASESDPAGAGVGQFTVRRSGGVARALDVSVRFSQAASTATQGADFEPLVRSVRIRAGRAYAHFNLKPIDDVVADPAETVVVKLHPSTAYDINPARPKVRLRILDNETSVSIFATDANASEESPTGSGRGEFTVRRFGPADEPLVVGYYVRNTSTATRGEDFESLSGTLTIPAGEDDVSFGVTPIDDDDVEDDEALVLTLRASADYARLRHTATVTIADNDEVGSQGWWDARWDFRVPLSVSAGAHARTDKPVERAINFTQLLAAAGAGPGSLRGNSIRVIETSADGRQVLDDDVPFQFDAVQNYNAATNAAGTLVFLMEGSTDDDETRHYHVYFDNAGDFEPPTVAPRVTTTDDVVDEGQASVRIATQAGTYFYQKQGGGFSSLLDAAGNDWISYDEDTPGSAGTFRGVPNTGDAFHPGYTDGQTTIVSQGPLKTTIESSADGGARRIRWEFFPTYARATVLEMASPYWFLYEGTPGGAVDGNDFVVRSDGTRTNVTTNWADPDGLGTNNGAEWAYFGDGGIDRFLYLAHHQADAIEDSYFDLNGDMTVFGFGRHNNPGEEPEQLMTAAPNTFTIGLASGGAFGGAASVINAAYRDISVTQSAVQTRT